MVRTALIALSSLLLGAAPAPQLERRCEAGIDDYRDAVAAIDKALRGYSACVGGSRGKDDCSYEFGRIKSAHGSFEWAVSTISTTCGR